jgi:hypothetical protein
LLRFARNDNGLAPLQAVAGPTFGGCGRGIRQLSAAGKPAGREEKGRPWITSIPPQAQCLQCR